MSDKQKISPETVFQQLYIEMRRYRNLEHRIVIWWTTILLAIMAAFVGFGGDAVALCCEAKVFAILFVGGLGYVMWRLMGYANQRYRQLRDKAKKDYYQEAFSLPEMCPSGFELMTWAMFIITVGFCILLLIPLEGATEMNAPTWIVAGPTIALVAITAYYAYLVSKTLGETKKMAKATEEQGQATRRLVEAALADRASLVVVEGDERSIKTVGDYAAKDINKIPGLTDDRSKHNWLVIEIKNVGMRTAWNVSATAYWEPLMDGYEQGVDATNVGEMKEALCDAGEHEGEYDGKLQECWRIWKFGPGKPRFFYFPPPGECDKNAHIKFTWYDPVYYPWTNQVTIIKKGCQWYTQWNDVATPVQQW